MIFDNFTWQAGATFFAAAVAGTVAAIIGWRQVGIARAAMEVAKAQSLTARLAQRGALFEKRFAAYMTVQSYLNTALHGDAFALIDFNDKMRKLNAEVRFFFQKALRRLCMTHSRKRTNMQKSEARRSTTPLLKGLNDRAACASSYAKL